MSLSASAENLTNENQNCESSTMCLELALEGERLCKSGDCRAGVAFFQAAIQAGTDDLRTLSAIYSQLGNAYFYLGDYSQAMQYHKLDLTLARTMGDKLGEAKSSGNLGNTLKVTGRFQEAALCCERHLSIARELGDRASEGRALYNLGNVFHAQGKHLGQRGNSQTDEDEQEENEENIEVRACLEKAVQYYQENLLLMKELGDHAAQGRACGNLGNTLYLLGDFPGAIEHHARRLEIAKQFGDKQAERRAHSNLGNSHIFLGEFETAAAHYKRTLVLAQELGERAVEAQACYSLGNTHTLLRDYAGAIDYHQRHLAIARQLGDRVGEARAAWSLGNAHAAMASPGGSSNGSGGEGSEEKALYYAGLHLDLSRELADPVGEATALRNIQDLRRSLGLEDVVTTEMRNESEIQNTNEIDVQISKTEIDTINLKTANSIGVHTVTAMTPNVTPNVTTSRMQRVRRQSMEQLDLIKLTPDGKQKSRENQQQLPMKQPNNTITKSSSGGISSRFKSKKKKAGALDDEEESFFDLLTRYQSERMDDQRCTLQVGENKENIQTRHAIVNNTKHPIRPRPDPKESEIDLLDMIEGLQGNRMDEQRVSLPHLPGLQTTCRTITQQEIAQPDDNLLEMIMRSQGSRIEEQRSVLPDITDWENETRVQQQQQQSNGNNNRGATVPDEDFFSLIMRVQGGRMDDQRATVNKKRPL